MHKTTLEQWRMFRAVVEAGGFNQAAVQVHKSQSSVHHAVGKLEQSLGVKLFEISGRKAVLTEAGTLMLRRGKYLLDEAERIEAVATALCRGVESELRVAVDGAFPQKLVFQTLETVSARYPQVHFDIIDTALSGSNELIRHGKADIALSPFPLASNLNEELCLLEFVAVAHPDHALHQLDRLPDYNDLKSCRQIVVRDSATQGSKDAGWLGAEQRWTVSNMRASVELVLSGLGYAWLPFPAICDALQQGQLKRLTLQEGATRSASFYMNYKDKDSIGPAAREFMGQLRLITLDMPTSED